MRRRRAQRGITLVETAVATLIVALLGGAAISAAEVALAVDREARRAAEVGELGLGLLEEIAALPFDDPETGALALGPDAGEWEGASTRALFDDVDDYAVWDGSHPLQDKQGSALALGRYRRAVAVTYVSAGDFVTPPGKVSDHKRITVTVLEEGEPVAAFSTVRVQGGRDVDLSQ